MKFVTITAGEDAGTKVLPTLRQALFLYFLLDGGTDGRNADFKGDIPIVYTNTEMPKVSLAKNNCLKEYS